MNIYRQLPSEEFNDLASRILYEDNHLLVVNKKVGEIVQGDKTSDEPLTETYKAFIGPAASPGPSGQRNSSPCKDIQGPRASECHVPRLRRA